MAAVEVLDVSVLPEPSSVVVVETVVVTVVGTEVLDVSVSLALETSSNFFVDININRTMGLIFEEDTTTSLDRFFKCRGVNT